MKSYQPLASDDPLYFTYGLTFLKSPDRSRFLSTTTWPEICFSHLVHPFVNSISGTMLMQLRCMAELADISVFYLDEDYGDTITKNHKNCFITKGLNGKMGLFYINAIAIPIEIPISDPDAFKHKIEQIKILQNNPTTLYLNKEEMCHLIPNWEQYNPKMDHGESFLAQDHLIRPFLASFTSTLLTIFGGHSLYEFVAPLQIKEVKQTFHSVSKLEQQTSLEGLYFNHNQVAFDHALDKAIEYEKRFLLKKQTDFSIQKGQSSLQSHHRNTALRFFDQKRLQTVVLPQVLQNIYDEKREQILKNLQFIKNPLSGMLFSIPFINTLISKIKENDISGALMLLESIPIPDKLKSPFNGQEMTLSSEQVSPMLKWKKDIKNQLSALEKIQEKLALSSPKTTGLGS